MSASTFRNVSWSLWGQRKAAQTARGRLLAFKPTASRTLAKLPARVVAIGPRFPSGDYLVTLEYARPLRYHNDVIQRIDAFRSELYQVGDRA